MREEISLSPGKWIWYPSARTLSNTFVLFRREFYLEELPEQAEGWITADSRYALFLNGRRVQWGPAPADPMHQEADPANLLPYLKKGRNVLAIQVLFYGIGDGTWVAGKPGLLYSFALTGPGLAMTLCSDARTVCAVDYGHRPGQFQRWYLRALQEEFDARRSELDWLEADFVPGGNWKPAMELSADGVRPSVYSDYYEYTSGGLPPQSDSGRLYRREIPMPAETPVFARGPVEAGRITWRISPDNWFLFRSPAAYEAQYDTVFRQDGDGAVQYRAGAEESVFLTYVFEEQMVGFPFFTIFAPAGTTVELMVQESHTPGGGQMLLDTAHHCWSRFICREGENRFQCFDFESVKWLQLHITAPAAGAVRVSGTGLLRRSYPYESAPEIAVKEPALQRLFDAGINTLRNAAIETLVDGMGRERQQYAGDCSHALIPLRGLLGNTRLSKRFIETYSDGLISRGYFLDCYPGIDRLKRIPYKQIGLSYWGPIIDHSVGYVGDIYRYVMETGDVDTLRLVYPKLKTFVDFLIREADGGLFPVDKDAEYCVWLDHHAYPKQRHRLCSMNLYILSMLRAYWIPIMGLLDKTDRDPYLRFADQLWEQVTARFWDEKQQMYWDNLPWREEEALLVTDRTLATAVLFDLCPGGRTAACAAYLAESPDLRLSYPANAVWRQWALGAAGRGDIVLRELREKWAVMPSVLQNNAYQEHWQVRTDSVDEWSHIPMAPMIALTDVLVGIRPDSLGYGSFSLTPQLADIGALRIAVTTVRGTVRFEAEACGPKAYRVCVTHPEDMEGVLRPRHGMRAEGLEHVREEPDGPVFCLPPAAEFVLHCQ